jgi:hypothetical protein
MSTRSALNRSETAGDGAAWYGRGKVLQTGYLRLRESQIKRLDRVDE